MCGSYRFNKDTYRNLTSGTNSDVAVTSCDTLAQNADSTLFLSLQQAGYVGKVKIGMDVAASEFFENEKYNLDFKAKTPDPEQIKTGPELQEQYSNYCKQYPIISIEDPFDQDDFDSYANFTSEGVCQVRC